MKSWKNRLPSPAMVIAIVALICATTGSAVAASSLITSAKIKNGTIKLADISESTKNSLKKGHTGAKGDKGDTGAQGPQGIQGAPGAAGPGARWALVKEDGTILAQSGGISVVSHNNGWYYLNVGASTTGKALAANATFQSGGLGRSVQVDKCGSDAALGQIFCTSQNDANGVFVQVSDKDGVRTDGTFYVSVF